MNDSFVLLTGLYELLAVKNTARNHCSSPSPENLGQQANKIIAKASSNAQRLLCCREKASREKTARVQLPNEGPHRAKFAARLHPRQCKSGPLLWHSFRHIAHTHTHTHTTQTHTHTHTHTRTVCSFSRLFPRSVPGRGNHHKLMSVCMRACMLARFLAASCSLHRPTICL